MSVHYPIISILLYTRFYNYNTKLELCSMATSGRVTAALSMVSLSEAFTGVHRGYDTGSKMADRIVSAVYDSHGFLLCIISMISCQRIYPLEHSNSTSSAFEFRGK